MACSARRSVFASLAVPSGRSTAVALVYAAPTRARDDRWPVPAMKGAGRVLAMKLAFWPCWSPPEDRRAPIAALRGAWRRIRSSTHTSRRGYRLRQRGQQRPRFLQVGGVEALGERTVDR